jgi:hypothetical protein
MTDTTGRVKVSTLIVATIPAYIIIASALTWFSAGKIDPISILGIHVAIFFGLYFTIGVGINLGKRVEKGDDRFIVKCNEVKKC